MASSSAQRARAGGTRSAHQAAKGGPVSAPITLSSQAQNSEAKGRVDASKDKLQATSSAKAPSPDRSCTRSATLPAAASCQSAWAEAKLGGSPVMSRASRPPRA